jgi:hypothetical protein
MPFDHKVMRPGYYVVEYADLLLLTLQFETILYGDGLALLLKCQGLIAVARTKF